MCPLRSRSGSKGIGSNPEKASRHNGSMQSAEAAPTPPACRAWEPSLLVLGILTFALCNPHFAIAARRAISPKG